MLIVFTGAVGAQKFAVDHKAIKIIDKAAGDGKGQQQSAIIGVTAIVVSIPPQVLTYSVKETVEEVAKLVNDAYEREAQLGLSKSLIA